MTKLISLCLFFGSLLLAINACQPSDASMARKLNMPDIPTLLDRNKALQNGKEWESVASLYGQYRAQLMNDPKALEPYLKLAELFINEARITGEHAHYYQGALKLVDKVLNQALEGKNKDLKFRALSSKASIQLSLHDFSAALESGKQALAINPYNSFIYGVFVDAYVELGAYEKAVEMADKMVSIRPDLRSYSRVSYLREIYGQTEAAIEAMKMAVEAGYPGQEQTCWARLTLGHLEELYGDMQKAEAQYRLALEERPDYPFATAALAQVLMAKKQFTEAESLLKKACEVIPEVAFFEQLAELYQLTGRKAEFERSSQEVLAMMEDDVKNGHNMDLEFAAVYANLIGNFDQALTYALKEYEKRPNNIDVNRRLALIYQQKGDQAKAKSHFEKATQTGSKHPDLASLRSLLAVK